MGSELSVKEKLKALKIWFRENPNLPEEIDTTYLKRFLKCMGGDVEETKKLLEHNYLLRSKSPHIFSERDPCDEATKKSYFDVQMVPLPGLTIDNYKVLCFRLVNKDARTQNSIEESKCFFMMTDARFTYNDHQRNYDNISSNGNGNNDADDGYDDDDDDMATLANGEIHIVDIANYTLRHLASMSLMVMRTYMNYLQEAYPVRLKTMHIINCPTQLHRMVAITRPFIREDVFNLIHFHTDGFETLYEHVPRDMLPVDYGGTARSLADITAQWWEIVKKNRAYLMDPKFWKVDKPETRNRWTLW
ncbi:alpha-tocopherol transfer protein-like [Haematobia irritans]|uniref:alpha-tocopherol transfer protein-like n=1 Tax=Haematobia irritans TaxID=7368 RepID=UPI003F5005C1